jgi:hypothetical protein
LKGSRNLTGLQAGDELNPSMQNKRFLFNISVTAAPAQNFAPAILPDT